MSTRTRRQTVAPDDLGDAPVIHMFQEWLRSLPMRRPFGLAWDWPGEDLIRVDEYRENDTEVIKAELPGIDPDHDVEITAVDDMLVLRAQRQLEKDRKEKDFARREIRSGTMTRTLALPEGVDTSAITARYANGILEICVPIPAAQQAQTPITIPVTSG